MSRIHRMFLHLLVPLCAALFALAPQIASAQDGAPPTMRPEPDSLPKPEVAPTISNLPIIRRRLEAAASSLANADASLVGAERAVSVRLIIGIDGSIESALVALSSGNPEIDSAGLRIVRAARFTPGIAAGTPVRSVVILPLRFVFPDS